MTKIAIPTRGELVDDHFGHCEAYTIYSIEDRSIKETEIYEAPKGCGCKSDIAPRLKEKGVTLLLAGNIGEGALNVLRSVGIEVIRGCSGRAEKVVEAYLAGNITDSGIGCSSHDHQCSH